MKHFVIGLAVFAGVAAIAGAQILPIGPLPVIAPAPVNVQALSSRMFGQMPVAQEEHRLPAGHFCINHKPRGNETVAHECHCGFQCASDGTVHEDQTCSVYCDHQACRCHPEEPCPAPKQ